jgi:hypothetical protein
MRVVSIDSKMPFKFNGPRTYNRVSEGLTFLAGVVMTFWVPTLMYCLVIGQLLPLYSMVFTQTVGAAFGVFMHKKQFNGYLSCVPVNHLPDVPKIAYICGTKKAA